MYVNITHNNQDLPICSTKKDYSFEKREDKRSVMGSYRNSTDCLNEMINHSKDDNSELILKYNKSYPQY